MKLLDHGYVELEQAIGGDHSVVASARRSRHVRWQDASKGLASDANLIDYLMRHRHGTPFEHNLFTFAVSAPLFVFREWQRHRIASYNELSGRYTKLEKVYYLPEHIRVPDPNNKQSSVIPPDHEHELCVALRTEQARVTEEAYGAYEDALAEGVAREVARMILPLNIYSEMVVSTNARSLMNFLSLRNAKAAQWEIQQYAQALEEGFKLQMPLVYDSFTRNGRIAP